MIALKLVKWIIAWKKKINFADLVTDAKSVAGFSPSLQFRVGRNDVALTRPGCQDSFKMAASEAAFFRDEFFRNSENLIQRLKRR